MTFGLKVMMLFMDPFYKFLNILNRSRCEDRHLEHVRIDVQLGQHDVLHDHHFCLLHGHLHLGHLLLRLHDPRLGPPRDPLVLCCAIILFRIGNVPTGNG